MDDGEEFTLTDVSFHVKVYEFWPTCHLMYTCHPRYQPNKLKIFSEPFYGT